MGALDLLHHLRSVGFELALTADRKLMVSPGGALDDEQRQAIRANRDDLVRLLAAGDQGEALARRLAAAVISCCRLRGDSHENRQALLQECLAASTHDQLDLAEHFEAQARLFGGVAVAGACRGGESCCHDFKGDDESCQKGDRQ